MNVQENPQSACQNVKMDEKLEEKFVMTFLQKLLGRNVRMIVVAQNLDGVVQAEM